MDFNEQYIKAVTELADTKTNRRFLNDSSEHAKLLSNLMIGRAGREDEVFIYSGALGHQCFNQSLLLCQAEKIRILLDEAAGQSVIDAMPDNVKSRIELRIVPQKNRWNHHFFVAGTAYRYEKDHQDTTAISNFNEPEMIIRLKEIFDKMWNIAHAI